MGFEEIPVSNTHRSGSNPVRLETYTTEEPSSFTSLWVSTKKTAEIENCGLLVGNILCISWDTSNEEVFTLLVWGVVEVLYKSSNTFTNQHRFVDFVFLTNVGHIVFECVTHTKAGLVFIFYHRFISLFLVVYPSSVKTSECVG